MAMMEIRGFRSQVHSGHRVSKASKGSKDRLVRSRPATSAMTAKTGYLFRGPRVFKVSKGTRVRMAYAAPRAAMGMTVIRESRCPVRLVHKVSKVFKGSRVRPDH